MARVPIVEFNNRMKCPLFGLGTWKSAPGEVTQAVKDAIDCGYRLFDCAHLYQNEREVGEALRAKIKEDVVKREDLFITSKLWNTHHKKEHVKPALEVTLANLGLEYLDLYLIHTPMGFKEGDDLFPLDASGLAIPSNTHFTGAWRAMEECVNQGLTKSIGLSNFNSHQIKQILDIATIKPVTNQVECHVYLNQKKMIDFCKSHGIVVTGYSPLGSPDRNKQETNLTPPLQDPKVVEIAAKYNKNPGQILIKFCMQRGVITIPKSVNKARIQNNINLFDFQISPPDMLELEALDRHGRFYLMKVGCKHKDYPFDADF